MMDRMRGIAALLLVAAATLPHAVARAQETGDWEARYRQRAEALAADDTRGHYALARWCESCHRPEEAARHYRIVLEADPAHARARQCLAAIEGTGAQGPGATGAARRHELIAQGQLGIFEKDPVRYVLQEPAGARDGPPLPLAIVYSYQAKFGRPPDAILAQWRGFAGYVAVVQVDPTNQTDCSVAIAEAAIAEHNVDRNAILVTDWQSGHEVGNTVARRPDLFRFGFSDSTWGGGPWPEAREPTQEQRTLLQTAHVYMKLTGADYKVDDPGFDAARTAQVRAFWEALGVRDLTIENYPPRGNEHYGTSTCIGQNASARAREWFERKLQEEARERESRSTPPLGP